MKAVSISFGALLVVTIGACTMSKKAAQPVPPSPPVATLNASPRIAPSVVSSSGIFAPGNAELTALQLSHKEASMQTLTEGYKLYTGVCTNCHLAKSIYSRPEAAWPGILTSMAMEAKISDAQKEAIYQYVLAIKATQPGR